MNTKTEECRDAVAGQVERPVRPLVERLRAAALPGTNRNALDEEAACAIEVLQSALHEIATAKLEALSLPGFDRMATDEQEADHQAGVRRVSDMLARMERAKAEHDAAMADAARFRWIDEHALSVDMVADPDNLVQVWRDTLSGHHVTGRTLREAVDEAMRHNVEPTTFYTANSMPGWSPHPTEPPKRKPLTKAATDVLEERVRQVEVEGWTPEQSMRLASMTRIAALLLAEIERLYREIERAHGIAGDGA